jgi:hypothetical protein
MKKEEISAIAQLLTAIKDTISGMEHAKKEGDAEQLNIAKQEILEFQKKLGELL